MQTSLADWETGFEPRITSKLCTPYKEYMGSLEKSTKDKCQYRLLRLPNNMAVISAALTVGVGSYANPDDALGLAHLLEHVLLKESSKYPIDESFKEFIPKHSGSSNEFTGAYSYSLDELTEMAVSSFSAVESKDIIKPTFVDHPLTKNELGKVIHFETLSNINEICLIFPLPDIRAHNRSRLTEYIRWPLNHEGPGSLTQYLRLKGLATYAVAVISSYEGYSLLNLSISVTPKGLKQYDQVVSAIFTYLCMLSESGPQEWIYNEVIATPHLRFDYYEQQDLFDYVVDLPCSATNDYLAPEYIISNGTIINGFNSLLISTFMDLINPKNYFLFIDAQSHEGIELSNTEKYYNVRYHVSELPDKLTTDFCQDESMLSYVHLPKPNDFFSDDFSVPEPTGPRPELYKTVPTLLKYNDGLELWYKQDDKFYLPKGVIKMEIKSPVINFSPRNRVMFDLLCEFWRYILAKELYNSSNMRYVVVKESIFNNCRDKLQGDLSYCRSASAATQASFWEANLLLCPTWDTALLEECLKDVTYEMLNNFLHMLFDQVRITMLVTGNFTEQQAMDTTFNVQNIINGHPLSSCEIPHVRLIQLHPGYYILPKMSLNEENTQSAAVANIQLGRAGEVRSRVTAVIFNDIFGTLFFEQLRTEEQLGYIVYSSLKSYSEGNLYLKLSIQGECNPIYFSLRITEFLRIYCQNIIDLDEDKIANAVKSLSSTLQEQLKTISSEASRIAQLPSAAELEKYPASLLALQRLLRDSTGFDINLELDSFMRKASLNSSQDDAYERLLTLYSVSQELLLQESPAENNDKKGSSSETGPKAQKIRIGFQMALESAVNAPDYHKYRTIDLANIGMCQTRKGIWVIDDIAKFQSAQRLHGVQIPITELVPKYKD
ncbi:hypothetical protein COEREDRAFT_12337 [Coemansia reversa NRRL 1564]|uniref:LuxS/MPP-like metallohydrolase n=1 Tax=Coemansia reversa (strain ATCC 12441 / NRRL 1564) TaxID=763665 RepID=A0A2G5B117_COERN|nr:hypothetical protein COEREDRAFT_12337 [Coemansia reversa NRRL 1564]|eukprot:PIA12701.1 hypothetical protein COEREDRAFT_12337 [Coemansia reversa NRRL 1564]